MVTPCPFPVELFIVPDNNKRDLGIAGWEHMEMEFTFQREMGMKSLKWEGIDTKNLFPHISSPYSVPTPVCLSVPSACDSRGAACDAASVHFGQIKRISILDSSNVHISLLILLQFFRLTTGN